MDREDYISRSVELKLCRAETEKKAVQNALQSHPVYKYVIGLPIEDTVYPAKGYLKVPSSSGDSPPGKKDYISWSMPAHDKERTKQKGCGFFRSGDNSVVFTACPTDHEHHLKGKRKHCWSLNCPECMNDTALRDGLKVEDTLKTYETLWRKKRRPVGYIKHWVVSPPQEITKSVMQTRTEFDKLYKGIGDSLFECGGAAGVTIFHPWRQKSEKWQFAPHFHSLCYGHIDTKRFKKLHPGWIIKLVHPHEKIYSIRHTVAYLMTHMGLGISEVDPDEVDWDTEVLNYLIPGILSPKAKYTEKDYDNLSNNRGKMVGSFDEIDWVQWTMDRLSKEIRIRYWGGVGRNQIREIDVFKQYKVRRCKECHEFLRTYDGASDSIGECVRYIRHVRIRALAEDFELAKLVFQRYKSKLQGKLTLTEFVSRCWIMVSSLEYDDSDCDVVMDGPFDRPDEYYEKRQAIAYGDGIE